jgi:hypothetical protein
MRVGAQATATTTVLGAALIIAGLHGAGGHGGGDSTEPAALAASYRPPAVTVAAAPHEQVMLARAAKPRAAARAVARHTTAGPATKTRAARGAVTAHSTRKRATTRRPASRQSFTDALMAAVAKIPTYRAGTARWVVSTAYDFWGTADWYHDVLYVSPTVPRNRLYDVAVHEWSHELSVLDYSGDVATATKAMNDWFGGSGLTGPERAADCMAILQGATWTHYTSCTDSHWRAGAAKLIHGHRL